MKSGVLLDVLVQWWLFWCYIFSSMYNNEAHNWLKFWQLSAMKGPVQIIEICSGGVLRRSLAQRKRERICILEIQNAGTICYCSVCDFLILQTILIPSKPFSSSRGWSWEIQCRWGMRLNYSLKSILGCFKNWANKYIHLKPHKL